MILVRAGVDVDLTADDETGDAGDFDVRVAAGRRLEQLRVAAAVPIAVTFLVSPAAPVPTVIGVPT